MLWWGMRFSKNTFFLKIFCQFISANVTSSFFHSMPVWALVHDQWSMLPLHKRGHKISYCPNQKHFHNILLKLKIIHVPRFHLLVSLIFILLENSKTKMNSTEIGISTWELKRLNFTKLLLEELNKFWILVGKGKKLTFIAILFYPLLCKIIS